MSSRRGILLITGGAGFIGRNVVRKALDSGYEVRVLDINSCKIEGVEQFRGDIRDREIVAKAVSGTDYIIHLAAITSVIEFEKNPVDCFDININGFLNVLNSARENMTNKVIYASSAAVYTGEHFSDTMPLDYSKQHNPYAQSKIMNEMHADYFSHSRGLHTIGLRFFNVFGDGENEKGLYASIATQFLKNKENGERLIVYGDGSQARDFIYVEDAAIIALKLLSKGKPGIYNVGTGKEVSYKHIANIIDKKNVKYVKNPLKSYQHLTKADTSKLLHVIGGYKFTRLEKWLSNKLREDI